MSWPLVTPSKGASPEPGLTRPSVFCFLLEGQKCSHQDPIESSDSYGDLSDAIET